jgi:hypothetical protein
MRTAIVAYSLLLASMGCRTVVPLASPAQDLSRLKPRTLLLTDSDRSVVRMTDARLTGDTLGGTVHGQFTAIPLSRLTEVRAVVAAPAKTAVLAAGVGGAAVLAAWMILRLTGPHGNGGLDICGNPDPSYCP